MEVFEVQVFAKHGVCNSTYLDQPIARDLDVAAHSAIVSIEARKVCPASCLLNGKCTHKKAFPCQIA